MARRRSSAGPLDSVRSRESTGDDWRCQSRHPNSHGSSDLGPATDLRRPTDATNATLCALRDPRRRLGLSRAGSSDERTCSALAEAADANPALIGHHFGGKQGLYLAVFEHIGDAIAARLGPAGAELGKQLDTMAHDRID